MNPALKHIAKPAVRGLYNPRGLKIFKSKLKRIAAGEALILNVNLISDSHGEGAQSDDNAQLWRDKGWLWLLAAHLKAKYGQDLGVGFVTPFYPYENPFWTLGSGWSLEEGYGISKNCAMSTTDAAGTADFPFTGTGVTFMWLKGPIAGSLNWKIDSGSATVVNCYHASEIGYGITEITGLPDGPHTLKIGHVSSTAMVGIVGAYPTNGATRGIRFNNMSRWGTVVGDFLNGGGYPNLAEGMALDYWQPALLIIAISINDTTAGTAVATYKSHVESLVVRAKNYGDVLLINTDATPIHSATQVQPYGNALKELAIQYNCAYLDLPATMGYGVVDDLGLTASNDHWNVGGHRLVASKVIKALG